MAQRALAIGGLGVDSALKWTDDGTSRETKLVATVGGREGCYMTEEPGVGAVSIEDWECGCRVG